MSSKVCTKHTNESTLWCTSTLSDNMHTSTESEKKPIPRNFSPTTLQHPWLWVKTHVGLSKPRKGRLWRKCSHWWLTCQHGSILMCACIYVYHGHGLWAGPCWLRDSKMEACSYVRVYVCITVTVYKQAIMELKSRLRSSLSNTLVLDILPIHYRVADMRVPTKTHWRFQRSLVYNLTRSHPRFLC